MGRLGGGTLATVPESATTQEEQIVTIVQSCADGFRLNIGGPVAPPPLGTCLDWIGWMLRRSGLCKALVQYSTVQLQLQLQHCTVQVTGRAGPCHAAGLPVGSVMGNAGL